MLLATKLMLDWLGESEMAEKLETAIATVIETWGSAPQPVGSQRIEMRRAGLSQRVGTHGQLVIQLDGAHALTADTKDHPEGVWTLPPSLRKCRDIEDDKAKAECETKFRAIGESDRMTLKFRKPAA